MIGLLCQVKSDRHILCEDKVVNRGCRGIVFEEAAFEWNPEKMGSSRKRRYDCQSFQQIHLGSVFY